MVQISMILLKSRQIGASSLALFKWQKEYFRYIRKDYRIKRIKSIFNI